MQILKNLSIGLFLISSGFLSLSFTSSDKVKAEPRFVDCTNPYIEFEGRIDSSRYNDVDLIWSGTTVRINFKGTSLSAVFKDQTGDNYYNIILDNDSIVLLKPDSTKKEYVLFSNLSDSKHSVEIFKRTEWDRGKTTFYGFILEPNSEILPKSAAKTKSIEFYGNSITAGYAVDDTAGTDRPDSIFTNNYLSYATLTAHHYNAKYHCTCKSGIGIMISWFPMIMPEIYDRVDPYNAESKWDFSLYQPDIVVINLLQNDSWLVNLPDHPEFKSKFGTTPPTIEYMIEAYRKFVETIRGKYPNANIICMLGNMDITSENSKWPGYVQTAVDKLADKKIFTHFVPYKNSPNHPTIDEQKIMAESLIKFIDENITW